MKKRFLLSLLMVVFTTGLFAESLSRKEMEAELEGKWALDENNNVTIARIINVDGLSEDEIYNNVLSYFTYNYNDGESVVQVHDKESGLIVGKGIYSNVHVGVSLLLTEVSTYHIVRVDVKPNKIRVLVTLTQYITVTSALTGDDAPSISRKFVSSCYPANAKGVSKTVMLKAFYKSYVAANETISDIEKGLISGHTGYDADNDW